MRTTTKSHVFIMSVRISLFAYAHTFITQDRGPFDASFCLTCAKYLRILRDPFLSNPSFFDFSFLLLLLEAREYKNAPLDLDIREVLQNENVYELSLYVTK